MVGDPIEAVSASTARRNILFIVILRSESNNFFSQLALMGMIAVCCLYLHIALILLAAALPPLITSERRRRLLSELYKYKSGLNVNQEIYHDSTTSFVLYTRSRRWIAEQFVVLWRPNKKVINLLLSSFDLYYFFTRLSPPLGSFSSGFLRQMPPEIAWSYKKPAARQIRPIC